MRHRYGVRPRRSRLTISQQFSGVLTILTGAAEILAKTASLQLHFSPALLTFKHWAIVAFQLKFPLLYRVARTVGVITANVQLVVFVDQVSFHGAMTNLAATRADQSLHLGILIETRILNIISGDKV